MNERHVFYCDNTLEGIFSGVYQAWDARVETFSQLEQLF